MSGVVPSSRFCRWILFFAILLVPARASAEPPDDTLGAIVHIDAYEHFALGAVVGDGRDVLVPLAAVEVDRPGAPDAMVIDRSGVRFSASLVATDRVSGLALLRAATAFDVEPFAISSRSRTEETGLYLFRGTTLAKKADDGAVAPLVPSWRSYEISVRSKSYGADDRLLELGAPLLDEAGDLVAMRTFHDFRSHIEDVAPALQRLRSAGPGPSRRSWIFYGGASAVLEGARADAGLGGTVSLAARWRDLVEARVDASLVFVVQSNYDSCGVKMDGSCPLSIRGVLTPSIGPRIRIGGLDGLRSASIAITPSFGFALGAEGDASLHSKSWALAAPGVTVSLGPLEARLRIRLPRGDVSSATAELGVGALF